VAVRRSSRRAASAPAAKPKQPLEREFQKTCVKWLDIIAKTHNIRYFAVPNGAHLARGAAGYSSLKAQGLKSGVPDLCILFADWERYVGSREATTIFIELKRPGESVALKGDQLDWAIWLSEAGFPAYCTNDFDDFKKIVEQHL
jgi:hypothetical protein